MGLQAEDTKGVYDDDKSTMPASPEMLRQTSEEQLLGAAGSVITVRNIVDCRVGSPARDYYGVYCC